MDNELLLKLYMIRDEIDKQLEKQRQIYDDNKFIKEKIFEDRTRNCIFRYINVMEKDNLSRDDLIALEEEETKKSLTYFNQYDRKDSRGRLIGVLNKGFYTMTNKELVGFIRSETGSCSEKNRLIDYMHDDVLKYRIAMMKIAGVYAKKSKEENKPYSYVNNRMYLLGQIAREMFAYNYYMVPEDALVSEKFKKDMLKVRK